MPLDVFAALGALVRAELVRNKPQPPRTPADGTVPQQSAAPIGAGLATALSAPSPASWPATRTSRSWWTASRTPGICSTPPP
ncbi:hypothetical protein ACWCPC_38565, partial [Streptomyces decoyicus]